ncbi:MSHA biogenesis protein MshP [Cellvibrio sp. pealriver]|uniref:MSHA biogenesis protein MshP n=1 Tax=Cellvibrio sp. pealriver TaxID=1622269 RepID=UPI00066FCF21|nr:MSHA biogenesis protein MshP [Cellvibrio sp. pealriver]
MCPDQFSIACHRHQRGFLLPLALFILVVMGVLALTISRTATQTNTATIQELTNIQSFYAAESGAQRGMQGLFLTTTTRNATDAACANMAINHNFASVNGLRMCSVVVSCSCRYQDGSACAHGTAANYLPTSPVGVTKSFYTIRSVGTCGPADHFRAQRIIEVGAYREQ